ADNKGVELKLSPQIKIVAVAGVVAALAAVVGLRMLGPSSSAVAAPPVKTYPHFHHKGATMVPSTKAAAQHPTTAKKAKAHTATAAKAKAHKAARKTTAAPAVATAAQSAPTPATTPAAAVLAQPASPASNLPAPLAS